MRAREFITESQRTLYHGTLIQNIPGIRAHGLVPTYGDFTANAYGSGDPESDFYDPEEDAPEDLVFAADKKTLRKCISAIMGYLRIKGIPQTVENFYRYGAICVMRDKADDFYYHGEKEQYYGSSPRQVEPDDYFSYESVEPDYVLVRNKLRSFLRRNGFNLEGLACYAADQGRKPLPTEVRRAA